MIINNNYQRMGSKVTSHNCLQTKERENKSFTVKNEHIHNATSSGRSSNIIMKKKKE